MRKKKDVKMMIQLVWRNAQENSPNCGVDRTVKSRSLLFWPSKICNLKRSHLNSRLKRDWIAWVTLVVLAFLSGALLSLPTSSPRAVQQQILSLSILSEHSEWFWTMMQFWAIVLGFAFIYKQIRLQSQANMLQTLQGMSEKWTSEFMLESRSQACSEYLVKPLGIGNAVQTVISFFEDMGAYRAKGVFDLDILWDQYSYFVENYWSMYKPAILKYRNDSNDDTWFDRFEALFEELQRYSARKGGRTGLKEKSALGIFVKTELEVTQETRRQRIAAFR